MKIAILLALALSPAPPTPETYMCLGSGGWVGLQVDTKATTMAIFENGKFSALCEKEVTARNCGMRDGVLVYVGPRGRWVFDPSKKELFSGGRGWAEDRTFKCTPNASLRDKFAKP